MRASVLFSLLFLMACSSVDTGPICGDGAISVELFEQCDGDNLGGNSCATQGFDSGVLSCNASCFLDTSGCFNEQPQEKCGDGIQTQGESCDDGNTANGDGCDSLCRTEFCGDGLINNNGEECDDANLIDSDACTSLCENARCGDGFVRNGLEECDDGNLLNNDGCNALCEIETPAGCGNGITEAGEQCDDGNTTSGDGCSAGCQDEFCGDDVVQQSLGEQCDDGNTSNGDGCTSVCIIERCGDGIDNNGATEQCDDGNQVNTDACTNVCQTARCGDSIVRTGTEQCDDGNTVNTDACTNVCQNARCGDGIVRAGSEQCDDGNTTNGDGCSSTCTTEQVATCGNGTLNAGEQCDDGNTTNGDGCEGNCTLVCGNGTGAVRATRDAANSHCYVGFSQALTWLDAAVACDSHGGYLAVITSSAENQLARKASLITDTTWIGAEDQGVEGTFTWFNNEPFVFSNFEPGQPDNGFGNEDCLHFFDAATSPTGATLTWNDSNCDNVGFVTGYICEIEPIISGPLVINEVDYDQINGDTGEFIEIKNTSSSAVTLSDFAVVLINGSNNSQYARFNLGDAGATLGAGKYLVIGNASVTVPANTPKITIGTDAIQNGAPDGIAIFRISDGARIDSFSYEGSITNVAASDFGTGYSLVEGSAFSTADSNTVVGSLCRFGDGKDTNNASVDWSFRDIITPGAANQ